MKLSISDDPKLMVQFARECVYEFASSQEPEQLVVARRAMLRASKRANKPEYWIDRFAGQLEELELTAIAGGYLPDIHNQCHETLDELESYF